MKVKDLRKKLENFDDEAEVFVWSEHYDDTRQVLEVSEATGDDKPGSAVIYFRE